MMDPRIPKGALEGRFYANLRDKLQALDQDEQIIDPELDYWENIKNIKDQYHINLTSQDPLKRYAKYYNHTNTIEVPKAKLAKIPRVKIEIIKPEKAKTCNLWPYETWKDCDIT